MLERTKTMRTHRFHFAVLTLSLLALAGCQAETGVNNRHIQGVVTLPPLPLWETELIPRSGTAGENNDEIEEADGPFTITRGYHIIRGWSEELCDPLDLGIDAASLPQRPDCDGLGFIDLGGDIDVYRVKIDYRGPVRFKARFVDQDLPSTVDIDLRVTTLAGDVLNEELNGPVDELDEDGNQVLDEEGLPVPIFPPSVFDTQSEGSDEFVLEVRISGPAEFDGAAYELVIVGNDPRRHFLNQGTEGNSSGFDGDPPEPVEVEALEMLVGAYLNNDDRNLGNPAGGTSCDQWTLDEDTETFWCAWDMALVQEVSVEANVLIDGMQDLIDNDCDGVADAGENEDDNDGDGFSIAEGDCNDADETIHPARGDVFGDRIDNDCDGWADNGPDDVDDDGDGFCESGRDQNGDGVCRGPGERGGFSGGDCNDSDPNINPALEGSEIEHNNIDDDCDTYDLRIETGRNTDGAPADQTLYWHETLQGCSSTPDAAARPGNEDWNAWSDAEELACGTNPFDPCDHPEDLDEDGLCDSDCIGTVGCLQDLDGDGVHNWDEVLCFSDPEDANSLPEDLDGDGTCNGKDLDADGDGFNNRHRGDDESTDCNDMDPNIHPHVTDPDTGEVTQYHYDIANGIDDDCDTLVDENREWTLNGNGEYVSDESHQATDEDGDGFPLGLRDCDDTNPDVRPGNYEVRSANVVQQEFNTVWLFAGDVISLNNTQEQGAARRTPDLVPYDIAKDRVAWELLPDWEANTPPQLVVNQLPTLVASFAKQPEVGLTWFEDPAADANGEGLNDAPITGFAAGPAPWEFFQELGDSAAAGKTNELFGNIATIEADSWDGDNDGYHVTFPEAGYVTATIDWTASNSDYDALFYCYYFDAINPPRIYRMPFDGSGLTSVARPESGTTIVPLPNGADCWFTVVGYSGGTGGYSVTLTPAGFGDDDDDE